MWAVVAASLAFWGLRMFVRPAPVPPHATPVSAAQTARGDIVRLFADPQSASPVAAQPALASRFKLIGVMAPKAGERAGAAGAGVALIAIDDKPARAFSVGARLDADLVLQTVSLRSAAIGPAQGAPAVVLELPPLPAPATGTLSAAQADTAGTSAGPSAPMPAMTPPPTPVPPPPAPPMQPPTAIMPVPPPTTPPGDMPPGAVRPRQR